MNGVKIKMKKRFITGILSGVMLISSLSVSASASYSDVKETDWYYSQVMAMTEKGLFEGKGNNMFCPDDTMTRAEFITVIIRAVFPDEDITSGTGEKWWQGAYEAAVEKGILEANGSDIGVSLSSFSDKTSTKSNQLKTNIDLDAVIQRQEMALYSVRALKALGETDIPSYTQMFDSEKIDTQYKESVYQAYGAGIIVGDEKGFFNPLNTLTRAEASTVLYRIIEKSARANVDFNAYAPITIYEGEYRTNRNAKEGDTFVKKDGTQIILKKGPNGILGEGQGVAPDVGLNLGLYTVQAEGGSFGYNHQKYGDMVDSTGACIQNETYYINRITGEGYWGKEMDVLMKAYPEPDYDGSYKGEVSKDNFWLWKFGTWFLNFNF